LNIVDKGKRHRIRSENKVFEKTRFNRPLDNIVVPIFNVFVEADEAVRLHNVHIVIDGDNKTREKILRQWEKQT
jgi:hypothetical protein